MPPTCNACNRTFSNSGNLARHKKACRARYFAHLNNNLVVGPAACNIVQDVQTEGLCDWLQSKLEQQKSIVEQRQRDFNVYAPFTNRRDALAGDSMSFYTLLGTICFGNIVLGQYIVEENLGKRKADRLLRTLQDAAFKEEQAPVMEGSSTRGLAKRM